ncbi:hypothetical protein J1N35_015201 [Gossypium stocksii]|uniref:Uncharacterized protein n=1 Tax=Gossypium stocksii TaxID=47602 RepID=A0A9D3VWG7_9ROSI|nr:hypothetical protein J1N35_015201 [Gossypium stocksii]
MPSCKNIEPSNSKRLSNMLGMMEQMRKIIQEISEALPLKEEAVHDVSNFDLQEPCFIVDHCELDNNSQQEFRIGDHGDELNMTKAVSDPIE